MADVLAAVCEREGETSIYHASVAAELAEAEVTRRACWRLWQKCIGTLSVDEELKIRQAAERAASTRSKCLRLLGLDKGPKDADIWDEFRRLPRPTSAPEAITGPVPPCVQSTLSDHKGTCTGLIEPVARSGYISPDTAAASLNVPNAPNTPELHNGQDLSPMVSTMVEGGEA